MRYASVFGSISIQCSQAKSKAKAKAKSAVK